MNTSGGFFMDSPWASGSGRASSSSWLPSDRTSTSARRGNAPAVQAEAVAPLKLSAKQEIRLMIYLDDKFNEIARGHAKRYESTSPLQTLPAYIDAVESLLSVIIKIPPYGNAASLLVSYLLRASSDITDAIPNYKVTSQVPAGEEASRFRKAQGELARALTTLETLDRVWNAILCGEQIVWDNTSRNAKESVDHAVFKRRNGIYDDDAAVPTDSEAERYDEDDTEHRTAARYLNSSPHKTSTAASGMALRDSVPILGSKGIRTVAQTDRVRIRNIIVMGKDTLFSWMREALDAPVPPRVVDEVTGGRFEGTEEQSKEENNDAGDEGGEIKAGASHTGRNPASCGSILEELLVDQGNLNSDFTSRHEDPDVKGADGAEMKKYQEALAQEEQEENGEMAEVVLPEQADENDAAQALEDEQATGTLSAGDYRGTEEDEGLEEGGNVEERVHFKELFDRKLDPDASEDEEADDFPQTVKPALLHKSSKREHSPGDEVSTKKQRTKSQEDDVEETPSPPLPKPHHQQHHRAAMPEWDLAFARLFHRTLQTISDIAEELGKEEGPEKRTRKEAGGRA
ncbi:hypothetical protein K437DRAFT_264594 [Tilletiaria anomala UBC 951]|uniref:Uncharacterized protein n=1 Tax=Tilletiaria anomala (strain ATCC 24038 / CBS 436.72 / UBC 951) TaxID=1037660 RepID=A0A066VD09_TILAU|nr:uncharacterized protein K437DRAFT_264594 [Tilletiaria anomala UBC 951]KDN39326.1 hypothetical protein K437DRAFT_264594 [Tilletiaria anomala UBC 951]